MSAIEKIVNQNVNKTRLFYRDYSFIFTAAVTPFFSAIPKARSSTSDIGSEVPTNHLVMKHSFAFLLLPNLRRSRPKLGFALLQCVDTMEMYWRSKVFWHLGRREQSIFDVFKEVSSVPLSFILLYSLYRASLSFLQIVHNTIDVYKPAIIARVTVCDRTAELIHQNADQVMQSD